MKFLILNITSILLIIANILIKSSIIEANLVNSAAQCPPGKAGLTCQLEDGCYKNPCQANATCDTSPLNGHAICTCLPGFSGHDCSIDTDECASGSPCEHGGKCVNTPGSFRCECANGFMGSRCEININECEVNPCQNDGTCLDEKGRYTCVCMAGYSGENCEIDIDECASNPCQNGATCKNLVNSFRCHCQAGFWGEKCQHSVNNTQAIGPPWRDYFWVVPPWMNPNECQIKDCGSKHHDRHCDQECNTLACAFDGGDCLQGTGNPWAKCHMPMSCWAVFKNGNCDAECNTQDCLYDGHDCDKPKQTNQQCDDKKPDNCLAKYANGICDEDCNSASCGWDGGDCESTPTTVDINQQSTTNNDQSAGIINPQKASTEALGQLIIHVQPAINLGTSSHNNNIEMAKLLRKVSLMTNTILKVLYLNQVENGTEIILAADNRKCLSSCYNNTELIAKFINAIIPRTEDFKVPGDQSPNAIAIIQARSEEQSVNKQQSPQWGVIVVCSVLMMVVCALTVMSIGHNKQKVKEKAVVWFPEGFKPVLSSRNRDPTDRKSSHGHNNGHRGGISTLQALGGNFFRGMKKQDRSAVSTNPNGGLHSTDIDRCTNTPNGGAIYHIPYEHYDEYSTYTGTDTQSVMGNGGACDEPLTPGHIRVDPINMEGPHGFTTLMMASMGSKMDTKGPQGLVAYGTTGEIGANAEVKELLNRGAQVGLKDKFYGETALHHAARHGKVDVARSILERCDSSDVNAQDNSGRTPLHAAIAADSQGVFELLLRCRGTDINAQANDGTTPLILATKHNCYSILETLILNDCEVTKSDDNGKTALHWAAATNNVDALRRLLSVRETNKDAQDTLGQTALFLAARECATESVELLLKHNANKDICDEMDKSPIDIARSRQHFNIVRLLEDYDPPSNANSHKTTSSTTTSTNNNNNTNTHLGQTNNNNAYNVVMPATPSSLTNSLSPISSTMMSPRTTSLHHVSSPTKTNPPPIKMNNMYKHYNDSNALDNYLENCQHWAIHDQTNINVSQS